MDFITNKNLIDHVSYAPLFLSEAFPPIQHNNPNSVSNFPVVAIIIIGMMVASLLLMAYYTLVIKCCLNWNSIELVRVRRFSFSRQNDQNQSSSYSVTSSEPRGLEQEVINLIPIIHYKEAKECGDDERVSCECAFCLNEFEHDEKLRVIPNCNHLFHIDCVDVWLQNNANCPLCRRRVSLTSEIQNVENIIGDSEDFVVIDLDRNNEHDEEGQGLHETGKELIVPPRDSISPNSHKKAIKLPKVSSMKDEGIIGIEDKDDGFLVQPIRRSFSLDLSIEDCGDSSGRAKRSLFSFGHESRSRGVVLPIHFDP